MVCAQGAFRVGDQCCVWTCRAGIATRVPLQVGQGVPGAEGVVVVRPQDPIQVNRQVDTGSNGSSEIPGFCPHADEALPGLENLGVFGAQRMFQLAEQFGVVVPLWLQPRKSPRLVNPRR